MSQLVRNSEELGARARENRRFASGQVKSINTLAHTATVDVGAVLADGTRVHLEGVPFSPQNPPAVGSIVQLDYFGTSTHDVRIVSAGLSRTSQGSVTINAGNVVNSLKKTGEGSGQTGDLELEEGSGVTITRTGKKFTIAASTGLPTPTCTGQIIFSDDGLAWSLVKPMVDDGNGTIMVSEETQEMMVTEECA